MAHWARAWKHACLAWWAGVNGKPSQAREALLPHHSQSRSLRAVTPRFAHRLVASSSVVMGCQHGTESSSSYTMLQIRRPEVGEGHPQLRGSPTPLHNCSMAQ